MMFSHTQKRSVASVAVTAMLLTGFTPVLSGCMVGREARIGANDGTDVCYAQRIALDDTRGFFAEDMLKGAAAGALAGAGIALLAGGNLQQTLGAAAAGAIVGGIVGGFWNQLVQQNGRDGAVQSVIGSARTETENLNKTQVALDNLVSCRRQSIAAVKSDYKKKKITKEEGENRLAVIRQQLAKDYEIASDINKNVAKRQDEYLYAMDQIEPGSSQRIKSSPAAAAKKPAAAAKDKPAAEAQSVTASSVLAAQNLNKKTNELQLVASKDASNLEG